MARGAQITGDVEVGSIPSRRTPASSYFDAISDQIVIGWLRRKHRAIGGESANSYFKRNMYRLIKAYLDAGQGELFDTLATRSRRSQVGVAAISDNPFKLALFAMWSDNQSLSRHQQRVFGNQMLYAYRHGVPPEHIIGFIRVAGSAQRIAEKLRSGHREPGY